MSKTAQEWQQILGLDILPDEEFLASLNALEGQDVVEGGGLEARGMTAAPMTPAELVSALVVQIADSKRRVRSCS